MSGLIGKKIGMTRLFDETGQKAVVTIIEAGPCFVTDVKTKDRHGYDAVQLGFENKREKVTTLPLKGHFKRAKVEPLKVLKEFDLPKSENPLKLGDKLTVDMFSEGELVDVSGTTKGRGFAGTIKRHGFSRGPKTHGQSDRHRAPGSIGQSSYPSRVLKGIKMSGRMGGKIMTVKNLKIIKVDSENNYLMVKGAIPGHLKNYVIITRHDF